MISILGCGWFGSALGKALVKDGHEVKGSTTSPNKFDIISALGMRPYEIKLSEGILNADPGFFECDTLVISIPPKLRSGQADYVINLQCVVDNVVKYNIKQVIYISSTGVYPESNNVVDENTVPKPEGDSGQTLFAAEELFRDQTEFKTAIVRFGGLVGPGRHPGRFFAGKQNVPNGQAPVNLIHLDDCTALTQCIIKQKAYGTTFNACSPHHPAKSVFYTQAASHTRLPLPHFIDELKDWKTVSSVNVAAVLNYEFKVDDWEKSFELNLY